MHKNTIGIWLFCLLNLMFIVNLKAQYTELRFPVSDEDIALYSKNKIMGETQWSLEDNKKVPYMSKAFDPFGRLVISVDYYHRKYFLYDQTGKVISILDSARAGNSFVVSEYKFKYFDNGLLREINGPNFKSSFLYDTYSRVLTENLNRNDSVMTNKYYYDDKLRLVKAIYYDPLNKPVQRLAKNYSIDGRLFNETLTQASETFSDSTLTIYEYNEKKQLFRKQKFRFQNFYFSTGGSVKPDHSATHYNETTIDYNLDDKGRPIAEEYTIKGDKLNYRYSTWAYDKNGLLIKETYRTGKAEPKIIENQYIYY